MTILGVGNVLLMDEGFGVHFVKYLAERYQLPEGVRIVDGGTLSYALLDIICGCERLIVVDVVKSKDEPGAIYRFTREELETRMPPATFRARGYVSRCFFSRRKLMERTAANVNSLHLCPAITATWEWNSRLCCGTGFRSWKNCC